MNRCKSIRMLFLAVVILTPAVPLAAQSSDPGRPDAREQERGAILDESFEGSANNDGLVTELNSTAGYRFNRHFWVDAGLPIYFIHASSSKTGATSTNGVGNPYVDIGWAFKTSRVNYSSNLNGAFPTADTKKGLSTGRATFDWDNHFSKTFWKLTPFADAGVGNSLSDRFIFRRPFTSLGNVAHFEAGSGLDLSHSFSVSVSGYDVAPWGTQKVFSRFIKRGAAGPGTVHHGRVFESNAETVGRAGLTRDAGFRAGIDFTPRDYLDFGLGYSRSMNYALDTVSFGVTVNVAELIKNKKGE